MSKGGEFRRLLKENDYVYSTGVTGALDASIAERVGLKFVYMSGYSTSLALLAKADLGFLSSTEMVSHAAQIADATTLPVIADADDGFGNALTVMRTVESYERAGGCGNPHRGPGCAEKVRSPGREEGATVGRSCRKVQGGACGAPRPRLRDHSQDRRP